MPPSYWPFNALPLPSFSRSSSSASTPSNAMLSPASARGTSPTHSSFPFFFSSPPGLSSSGTPSPFTHDVASRGPLTPDQVMEMEEQDLFLVDRALMDFAAGTVDHDTAWISQEKDIRVNALWVHPIKSCRGVSLQKSVVTPQGLQYDRQWAIREVETEQMCTAREHPSMVLITPEIDEAHNLLKVTFPAEAGLPGFAVRLQVDDAEVQSWQRVSPTIMHKKPLPPSYLPAYIPLPGTVAADNFFPSPDEQLSTYFSKPVQFIQKSPFIEDIRTLAPPPVTKEMKAKGQQGDWLTTDDLEYGLAKISGVKQERGVETGYADGYPVLLANEESFKNVQSSLATAVHTPSDATFGNLGPSFDKDAWKSKTLDIRRFRANVILGRGSESKGLDAWEEERWREVEFWGEEETIDNVQIMDSSDEQDQDMEMTETVDPKLHALSMLGGRASRMVKRGGMVCVSRCGRCQLPNVNPETAEADKAVPYKILAKYRRVDPAQKFTPIFGVNAVPQQSYGVIHVGDRVRVKRMNNWETLGVASKD